MKSELWQRYFPRTFELLGESSEDYVQSYLWQMELSPKSPLEAHDLRYFAGFVRQKSGRQALLSEVAQWEGAHYLLSSLALDFDLRADVGMVVLSPSLQSVILHDSTDLLKKEAGLYVLAKNGSHIVEHRVSPFQAQLLDLVQEDRKFTPDQLLQMAELEADGLPVTASPLKAEEKKRSFNELLDLGILKIAKNKESL